MAELVITPEMSGKIVDESHFDFHVTAKAKVLNALDKMRGGADFIKTLAGLDMKTDPKWLRNSCKDPSVQALLSILDEYKAAESRPSRAKVLVPLIEYAIALYASDLFYKERGAWFIHKIIERHKEFEVCHISCFADPKQWYPNTRNVIINPDGTVAGDWKEIENRPDTPGVEEDYLKWYGIDVHADTVEIDPAVKERIIKEGQSWVKNEGE